MTPSTQERLQSDDSLKSWYERLKFYTRDLTKDQAIQLCDYVAWVKWEGLKKEADSIKQIITKTDTLS